MENKILIPQVADVIKNGKNVILPLYGYSMRPYLEDGRDKALLISPPERLKVGDVILAKVAQETWAMHRIVKIDGDRITMCGDGNFMPEYIKHNDVIALAVGFYRRGSDKLDSVDDMSYKVYWRLWVWMRPVRRWLLLIWKFKHYPKQTLKRVIKKMFRI